jgi:hypothetical protein
LSNVEFRQLGQGFKLGKYPLHFKSLGDAGSESFVKSCSLHHTYNRGIGVSGSDNVTVEDTFVFDSRGHAIFTEDGTERFNVIRHNLVSVVRPIWSLLAVDQSPACFWLANPTNDLHGNVCGGSSHFGFWLRALDRPDGRSGLGISDDGDLRCPNWAKLGKFEDNVAHSTGQHGFKVSNYFPVVDGYMCPTDPLPLPTTFRNLTAFKNKHVGVWGELLVDVSFKNLRLADQLKAGFEGK